MRAVCWFQEHIGIHQFEWVGGTDRGAHAPHSGIKTLILICRKLSNRNRSSRIRPMRGRHRGGAAPQKTRLTSSRKKGSVRRLPTSVPRRELSSRSRVIIRTMSLIGHWILDGGHDEWSHLSNWLNCSNYVYSVVSWASLSGGTDDCTSESGRPFCFDQRD